MRIRYIVRESDRRRPFPVWFQPFPSPTMAQPLRRELQRNRVPAHWWRGALTLLSILAATTAAPAGAQVDTSPAPAPLGDTIPPDTAAAPSDTTDFVPAGAVVVFRGDTLFILYGSVGPFGPAERSRALIRRIDSLSNTMSAPQAEVVVRDSAGVTELLVGSTVLLRVTAADTAVLRRPSSQVAESYAERLEEAIHGNLLTKRSFVIGMISTLFTTIALVLILVLMGRFFPTLYAKLDGWRTTRIPAIRIQRYEVVSASQLADALIGFAKVMRVAAVVLLLYFFLPIVLGFFPATRRFSVRLIQYVVEPLQRTWSGFVAYLPDLITVLVIVAVIYYLIQFIQIFFKGLERGAIRFRGFYREWADPTYKIVRFMVIVFAVIMIYPYLPGSDTAAFKGISVFVGVLISFGSSSAIANVVAGIVMTYMRPFQIGDRVRISDTVGDVIAKTLLVTRVRTIKNVNITIPNAMVLSSHIINFSTSSKQRGVILHTAVTIGYDVPWKQVHDLLITAAKTTDKILEDPAPFVLQTSLNDFNVTYELNAYTEQPNEMADIYSELHQNIQNAFNEAGVEIMSPSFAAVRDGNRTAIPDEYLPPSYTAPAFGIRSVTEALRPGKRQATEPEAPVEGPLPEPEVVPEGAPSATENNEPTAQAVQQEAPPQGDPR